MKHTILVVAAFSLVIASCKDSKEGDKKSGETSETTKSGAGDEAKVKEILETYKSYTVKEDFEGMINFISPALLEQTTKEDLVDELRAGMHNENYDLRITDIDYTETSKVVEKDGNKYAKAKTNTSAVFKLKDPDMYEGFCEQFKAKQENVECNPNDKTVSLTMKGEAYVVYTEKDKKWSILSDTDPKNVQKVIPSDIRTELGIVLKSE
jgi:hypothetical protein